MPEKRPSDARRAELMKNVARPAISNFFPITRYYEAADTLFRSIEETSRIPEKLDVCYVYCRRYAKLVTDSIPTHNYYDAPKYSNERLKHIHQLQLVVDIVEKVARQMDIEELRKEEERAKEHQKRLDEFTKQQQAQRQAPRQTQQQVAQSALDKLNALNGVSSPPIVATGVPVGRTRYRLEFSEDEDEDAEEVTTAPVKLSTAILPPMSVPPMQPTQIKQPEPPKPPAVDAPPSYHEVLQSPTYDSAVKKYHPFSYSADPQPTPAPVPNKAPRQSLSQLQTLFKQSHRQLQSTGRIRIQPLGTYQGRISSSTNGCTVISALVAAYHLNNSPNISNDRIGSIIDRECCPVLKEIRKKLGLGGHALIIPSDVHDHLVDAKILSQNKFSGAAGGNILNKEHYGEFLKLLAEAKSKASATFFYREHVTSIVKCIEGGRAYYDWVDSLPGTAGRATRTRCADAHSLEVQLQWYALSKLRSTDDTPWDDSMADLDPRVFQGFVWCD